MKRINIIKLMIIDKLNLYVIEQHLNKDIKRTLHHKFWDVLWDILPLEISYETD